MKIYRDWKPNDKIRLFAERHGLEAVMSTPPGEVPYLRVWFDANDDTEEALERRACQLFGETRGGFTA